MQILPRSAQQLDLKILAAKLRPFGKVMHNEFLVKCLLPDYEMIVFPDGRAIVKGTTDPAAACALYSKFVGN